MHRHQSQSRRVHQGHRQARDRHRHQSRNPSRQARQCRRQAQLRHNIRKPTQHKNPRKGVFVCAIINYMTPEEFAQQVRFKTRTNSTTFTNADILALMKVRQIEIARNILKVDEDILLIPQTTDLVKDQREYSFAEDAILKIKRVEAALDGTNWLKLSQVALTDLSYALIESEIVSRFSNTENNAKYMLSRKALYLLSGSVPDVDEGLKVWFNTWPSACTDLTGTDDLSIDPSDTTHGIPSELHEIWARGVIVDYKSSREKPIPLTESEQRYNIDMSDIINSLRNTDMDRQITGKLPAASDRGYNGFSY